MFAAATLVALLAALMVLAQNPVHQLNPDLAVGSLVFPPNRGSHSLVARNAPCQGWERGIRIDYPVTGGVISWATARDIKNAQIRYSTNENPTSQDQFSEALTNITGGWVGLQCIDGPNFASLGLSAGDAITMQFTYTSGPQNTAFYECADVNLVSADEFTAGNWDTQCVNRVTRTQTKRISASNPELFELQQAAAAEAAAANSTGSNLTVAEGGGIGAGIALGVVTILAIVAYFAGLVSFGKKQKKVRPSPYDADAKTISSV